jgi:hypothetical protein
MKTLTKTYYNLLFEENVKTEVENILTSYNPANLEDAKKLLQLPIIQQLIKKFKLPTQRIWFCN